MEDLITELSKKYNIPKAAVRAIIQVPFDVMSESMRKKEFKNFIFLHLGKFVVLQNRYSRRKEYLDEQAKGDINRLEEQLNQE